MGFMDLSEACSSQVILQTKPSPSAKDSSNCGRSNAAVSDASPSVQEGGSGGSVPGAGGAFVSKHVSALQIVEGFLDALTNASRYTRLLFVHLCCQRYLRVSIVPTSFPSIAVIPC